MTERKPLPYVITAGILFYCLHWLAKLFEMSPDTAINDDFGLARLEWMAEHWTEKFLIDVQFTSSSLMAGLVGVMAVLFFFSRRRDWGNYRSGEEHGSARFATPEELLPYADADEDKNLILSKNAKIGLYDRRLPYQYQMNKNVWVQGPPGTGKTYNFVKPNLQQLNASYLVTDTKGLLVHETGQMFENAGYVIKIFDLINFSNSNRFNVYRYMESELDIDWVAETVIAALKKTKHDGEDFWEQAKTHLVRTLIGYLYFDGLILKKYMPNLTQIADLLRNINRKDPDVESPFEMMMEQLNEELPNNYAYKQWVSFNEGAKGRTRDSVVYIVTALFSVFDHEAVRNIIAEDNLEIETWNTRKTVAFINIPEDNKAFAFISALLFSTAFKVMFRTADAIIKGFDKKRTLIPHRTIADEIAQVGKIPGFVQIYSTGRSRLMSFDPIFQSKSQAESLYGKEDTQTLINNSGTLVYLGSNDSDTLKFFSERTGTQTVTVRNQSKSFGQQGSSSESTSQTGRKLMTPDEVARIGGDEALVFLAKQNVLRDKKARVSDFPNADQLSDDPTDDNWYTYKRYMSDIDEWLENVEQSNQVEISVKELEEIALPWDLSA